MRAGLRWFAVMTKPLSGAEAVAAREIKNQEFPVFVPLCSYERNHNHQREKITAPLFPRYLFARFDLTIAGWQAIAYTRGVQQILGTRETPQAVPIGVVEELIEAQEAQGGAIALAKPEKNQFKPGEKVHFVEGNWLGIEGIVELDEEARVRVLLDILGGPRAIPVPRESIARS